MGDIYAKEPVEKQSGGISSKEFAFKWKLVSVWNSTSQKKNTTFFSSEEMLNITPSSSTGKFVAEMRDCGFNAIIIDGSSEATKKFASYVKKQGMGSFITA